MTQAGNWPKEVSIQLRISLRKRMRQTRKGQTYSKLQWKYFKSFNRAVLCGFGEHVALLGILNKIMLPSNKRQHRITFPRHKLCSNTRGSKIKNLLLMSLKIELKASEITCVSLKMLIIITKGNKAGQRAMHMRVVRALPSMCYNAIEIYSINSFEQKFK